MKKTIPLLAILCVPQAPIDSLDTRHYYQAWLRENNPMKVERYLADLHAFRARHYGRIEGEQVTYPYNSVPVSAQLADTSFLGLKVRLHRRVIAPLKCVEQEILRNCQSDGTAYVPKVVSGYRSRSSYKRVISNHQFGIAIDFDPLQDHSHDHGNPCCGPSCETSWRTHPICNGHDTEHSSPYNVAKVNPCWVESFRKFGFHWLINFRMHDTMHFEYLAEPSGSQSDF